ncbi:MAG: hypothetical protein K2I63_03465 [Helicobacter sp.]|nr:hypothetical protein [Helicobacter sp.]
MITGISSNFTVASGSLDALKKAIDTEETLMSSILTPQSPQQNLTASEESPEKSQTISQTNGLDIMA